MFNVNTRVEDNILNDHETCEKKVKSDIIGQLNVTAFAINILMSCLIAC